MRNLSFTLSTTFNLSLQAKSSSGVFWREEGHETKRKEFRLGAENIMKLMQY